MCNGYVGLAVVWKNGWTSSWHSWTECDVMDWGSEYVECMDV